MPPPQPQNTILKFRRPIARIPSLDSLSGLIGFGLESKSRQILLAQAIPSNNNITHKYKAKEDLRRTERSLLLRILPR